MKKIDNPVPLFLDARGSLLDGGHIYIGTADADPQVSPIQVFWDDDGTVAAEQPLRTLGGRVINDTTPSLAFVNADDFSIRVTDALDVQIDYIPSVAQAQTAYQPLSDELTAIDQAGATSYGISLLSLANQAELAAATGIQPFTGGTITKGITLSGSGIYPFWDNAGMVGGRMFLTPSGAADPTNTAGQIWFTY